MNMCDQWLSAHSLLSSVVYASSPDKLNCLLYPGGGDPAGIFQTQLCVSGQGQCVSESTGYIIVPLVLVTQPGGGGTNLEPIEWSRVCACGHTLSEALKLCSITPAQY